MEKADPDYKACLDSNPACDQCRTLCCSTLFWGFPPPPFSDTELPAIRAYYGDAADGLIQRSGDHWEIRERDEGSCAFLDPESNRCRIYPVRPYDCRAFPFDFITETPTGGRWILWDCDFSRQLSDQQIEHQLENLEREYPETIRALWWYNSLQREGNEIYRRAMQDAPTETPQGLRCVAIGHTTRCFRLLRMIRLPPRPGQPNDG